MGNSGWMKKSTTHSTFLTCKICKKCSEDNTNIKKEREEGNLSKVDGLNNNGYTTRSLEGAG